MVGRRRGVGVALVLSLLLGVFGVAAVATARAESPSGRKVTFTMGTVHDMTTANPFGSAGGASEYEMFFLNYDMLYNFSQQTLEPVAALAEYPPQQSDGGATWTFEIRSGVTWSDGVPLTAHDIAFTYNLVNEKGIGAFKNELGVPIKHDAFEAPNDTTLIWHMQTPTLSPLSPPWLPIVPEHIWGKYMGSEYTTKDIKEFRNVPAVGSGPFHLTEWKEGQYFTLEANPDYFMGAPHIDEIVFRVYQNPEALSLALTSGEVDAVDSLPPSIFNNLEGQPNIGTNVADAAYYDHLAFNFEGTGDPSLRDQDVRDAIALAIDRQTLVDRVTLGYATVGNSVVPPVFARWHWEPTGNEVQAYDPTGAERLLDTAGYEDVNGDGWRETPDGEPWSLEVLTIADEVYSVPEGKLIVGWMKDVGIRTTIKTVSEGKAYDVWGAQDFDMYVWAWGPSPDPDFILSIFTTDMCLWWSDGCYSDPAYDQMYEEQRAATDPAAREALVQEMQRYLYDENPEIVLLYPSFLQAYRTDRFTGFVKQPAQQGSLYYAYGPYSYMNITPVTAEGGAARSSTGVPVAVWIVLGVVVLIGAVVALRRRSTDADAE